MEHFSHPHPLLLSKYNNSPNTRCHVCRDKISINADVYHCINQSTANQDSRCASFHLHKTCAELPMRIQHHLHPQHVLSLSPCFRHPQRTYCDLCYHRIYFYYQCTICTYDLCSKCASVEREIKHPSHNHTLTLLPFRAILHTCTACGTKGREEDFTYLCQRCLFCIHKSCASAPTTLTHKDHHDDHPLVLAYSLPKQYRKYKVSCSLCPEEVDWFYWLYYCDICRYFAHVQCALSAPESSKDGEENDVDGSNVVHFPVSENEPYILYQLIQQLAKKLTISSEKANVISECRNGHSLILFDDFNNKSDKRICDGCVQPLLSTPDPFYGCIDCNFFLHNVCAAELPREIQHASHPKLTRCQQTGKPSKFYLCEFCCRWFNGIGYSDDSGEYRVDIVCAALPSEIKHDSHGHTLRQLSDTNKQCRACDDYMPDLFFGCQTCDYYIHIKCALIPGTIKHRWDEHQLILMYPPVKGHPHDFDCEFCSRDINPNYWFYHCPKCDTSFHTKCINTDEYSKIKYGGIVRDDNLHQHNLKFTKATERFKCGLCGLYRGYFNGIGYSDDSGRYKVDIVCAALPSEIKHDSHGHTLRQLSDTNRQCRACDDYMYRSDLCFGCQTCDYYIHIKCALIPDTIKHRWDEHQLILMYPPVRGHPHDFDCELCSRDINPNYWFYHCPKCDTSFHTYCINPHNLHQHNLNCGLCGLYHEFGYPSWKYKCESCKFSVCSDCFRK